MLPVVPLILPIWNHTLYAVATSPESPPIGVRSLVLVTPELHISSQIQASSSHLVGGFYIWFCLFMTGLLFALWAETPQK